MLRGISKLISPELLKILCEMGHGDEIIIADGNFPSESVGKNANVIRADGIGGAEMLEAILPLFPLDQYDSNNFVMMQVVPGDPYKPVKQEEYIRILKQYEPDGEPSYTDRFAFYDRAKGAYAIIATGESAQYANIILKKGVVKA